jgi:hypothetical protein
MQEAGYSMAYAEERVRETEGNRLLPANRLVFTAPLEPLYHPRTLGP